MENEKENMIVDLNKSGMSSKEIAEQVKMSGAYICKILKKYGLKANVPLKFGTYEFECIICKSKFMPKSREASTCGPECKRELQSQKTTEYAIKNGAENVITPDKESTILVMRSSGKSIDEISKRTGLSSKSVRQWIGRNTDMTRLNGNDKYAKRMTKEEKSKAISLSKQGVHVRKIAQQVGFSNTSVKDFLIKQNESLNIPISSDIYSRRMDHDMLSKILKLHTEGKNVTDIAKEVDFTTTSIRSFLRKRGIKPNIVIVDYSRPCAICKVSFKPKYSDGKDRNVYKTCSPKCSSELFSKNRTKYNEVDINAVINMAKEGYSNETIVKDTGVKISKVKEIVTSHELYRSQFVGGSASENEVKMFVESLGLKADKFKFPTLEGGKEIDILTTLEDGKKIGIEYCGLYWHSEGSRTEKARSMHLAKLNKANYFGISLLTIFGDEWSERQDQVKGFIKSKLGKNEINLYARNLDVKTVEKQIATEFLNLHHIQGSSKVEIAYGLYMEEELVAIMTGSKHHRQGNSDILVLNRLAFKRGISVVGGSSRLFKKLVEYGKSNNYNKIISWSDNRWSEGNVYKKLGFELEGELDIDYSYVHGNTRISKQSCQKKELVKKGAIGNTEKEMALSLGLYRIWDCGKKRWSFDLK